MWDNGRRAAHIPRVGKLWALAIAVTLTLVGCASPSAVHDTLLQAAKESQAAVASGSLTLRLVRERTVTHAVAETTFIDMTRQMGSAQTSLIELELSSPDDRTARDATAAAVQEGTTAVLAGRDCLQTNTPCAEAEQLLQRAGDRLAALTSQLEASG